MEVIYACFFMPSSDCHKHTHTCYYAIPMPCYYHDYEAPPGTPFNANIPVILNWGYDMIYVLSLIARFMGQSWGPSGADRTQVGPMLVPWTLLSGLFFRGFCFVVLRWSFYLHDQWRLAYLDPGAHFNIKKASYQHNDSHDTDKTLLCSSYLHKWEFLFLEWLFLQTVPSCSTQGYNITILCLSQINPYYAQYTNMNVMTFQITNNSTVCSTACSS